MKKGTNSVVWADSDMPRDEEGFVADICADSITVFNRMNFGQQYEQFFNRGAELVRRRAIALVRSNNYSPQSIEQAFAMIYEYLHDLNPNWADLVRDQHPNIISKQKLLEEVEREGLYIQISPFQNNISPELILKMSEKYGIKKSKVTWTYTNSKGERVTVTSKKPVMIGAEYFYTLYKMPHMRCTSIGYVNQYHSPVRASALAKLQDPHHPTPIRLGEDEKRNLEMVAPEAPEHIIGVYANSTNAVNNLGRHLLFDECPSRLEKVDMTSAEIIKDNSIVGVMKHMFSCMGVNVTPDLPKLSEQEYSDLLNTLYSKGSGTRKHKPIEEEINADEEE